MRFEGLVGDFAVVNKVGSGGTCKRFVEFFGHVAYSLFDDLVVDSRNFDLGVRELSKVR